MTTFLLIDTANTFARCRHVSHKQSDTWDKIGFAIHTTLGSVAKAWREQKADHVVFCLEGHSWRKGFYPRYKANRAVARAALTEAEQEENQLFYDASNNMQEYLLNKTNCTVLQHPQLEADDLIAGWIQSHPDDKHVIISSDTDYYQLISDNVIQFNGITEETITLNGFFDKKGKIILDKKTKEPKTLGDPKWLLFEKCMRGDSTDFVFSAYPGVREKGTKNKVGLREAFADKDSKGFAWNNMMLQRWTDHEGVEHRVMDDYARNVKLIDLTAQPEDIRKIIDDTVAHWQRPKTVPMVGAHFMKFCGKYDLIKLSEQAQIFGTIFNATYKSGE